MRELTDCPICGCRDFQYMQGFDFKPGPQVYEYLGLPETKSRWSICKKCGFLFQNPRPTTDAIISLYQSGLYRAERKYDEAFFRSRYEIPSRHLTWAFEREDILPNRNVLDIGAGFGGAVRDFFDQGFVAKGVELDQNLCKVAKERFEVDLINSDIMSCDFPSESFGLIYSAHVHEHFDDFEMVNRKLVSWLAPGGYLLCILPTYRCAAKNGQGFINVFHNSIFTKISLRNMFIKSGLEPVLLRYPVEHSFAEVWGLARKPGRSEGGDSDENSLIFDSWQFVAREVQYSPALFELLYLLATPFSLLKRLIRRLRAKAG